MVDPASQDAAIQDSENWFILPANVPILYLLLQIIIGNVHY